MNNRERIVIFGAMVLLIALNITVLANGRGPEVWAALGWWPRTLR